MLIQEDAKVELGVNSKCALEEEVVKLKVERYYSSGPRRIDRLELSKTLY